MRGSIFLTLLLTIISGGGAQGIFFWLFGRPSCSLRYDSTKGYGYAVCTKVNNYQELLSSLSRFRGEPLRGIVVQDSPQLKLLDGQLFSYWHWLKTITITKTNVAETGKHTFFTRSGQLSSLYLQKNNLTAFPKFEYLDWHNEAYDGLLYLDLSFNRIKEIKEDSLQNLRNLEVLKAKDNEIYHIGSKAFVHNRELKEIDLSFNKLTILNNEAFKLSTGYNYILTSINLTYNNIAFPDLGNGKPPFDTALNFLDLRGNFLSSFPEAYFKPLLEHMAHEQYVNNENFGKIYLTCTKEVNRCKLTWILRQYLHLVRFEGNRCNRLC